MPLRSLALGLAAFGLFASATTGAVGEPTAATAAKQKKQSLRKSPDLWSTVNLCDTEGHPNEIGVRGSMPGLGNRAATLYMRFRIQYFAAADQKWHNIRSKADSGYRRLGRSRNRVLESGWTFKFLPPPDGGAHTLRGSVIYVWRSKGRRARRIKRTTEAGHRSTAGADPPGFSAATCSIG